MENKIGRMIGIGIMVAIGFVVFITLGGFVVRELWNWLLPDLFGWAQITFTQALGLLVLCRILFGGFGMRGPGRHREGRPGRHLTPEEKEHLRHSAEPASSES